MSGGRSTIALLIMAGLIGVVALIGGSPAERLLGGLALLVAAGLGWTSWRGRRQQDEDKQEEPRQLRTPELSVGERLLPYFFITAAVLIVVAMTAYTLWYLGLR